MTKILGLDLGTASIGWALVERNDTEYALLDQGVDIFQEGVAREKNSEKPAVQDRTAARALRRHYARRRLRKIDLLRVLVRHDLCPALTDEQLKDWKQKKIYPLTDEFIRWQRTDDRTDKNPYRDRYKALTETLDLDTQRDRYTLGRALYHLAQRRGFLSNRKDAGDESESGKVRQSIEGLTADMEKAGCSYLGEYFYRLYARKEKIRTKYTSRNEHYLAEFRAICEKQRLADDLRKALHRAIFYQRPLKSQKGSVGRCTFEKDKSRCPASHPRFEEFRMLSFVNNIRITTPDDPEPRPLSRQEAETILPLFTRKTKPHFDFEEIAKKLAGKGRYACQGDRGEAPYRFNFARTATVTGCPVTASLIALFGDDYLAKICDLYTLGAGKTREQILGDVWHALFSFDDEERLSAWAKQKLRLSDDEAGRFAAIRLPQDYAALSLHAINKILPYLRAGYRYDEAVFVANLKAVLPPDIYSDESERNAIEADIAALITDFRRNPLNRGTTKEQCVRDYLRNCRGIDEKRLGRLYHPSMIEIYQTALPDAQGVLQLGSPRTPAVRNPMAMRALFRLRVLVNRLLRDGKIDRETKIHIEFAPRTQRCQPPQGYRAVPARPRGRAQSVRRRNPPTIRLGIGPGDRTHRRRHPEVPSVEGAEPHLPLYGQTDRPVRLHGRFRAFRYRAYRPPSEGRRQLANEQDPLREPLQPRTQARQASVRTPESRRRHGKDRRTRVAEGNRQLAKTDRNTEAQEQKRYDQIGKGRSHTAPPYPADATRLLARQVRALHDDGSSRRVQ